MKNFLLYVMLFSTITSCTIEDAGFLVEVISSNDETTVVHEIETTNYALANGFERLVEGQLLHGFLPEQQKFIVQANDYSSVSLIDMDGTIEKIADEKISRAGYRPNFHQFQDNIYWQDSNHEFAVDLSTGNSNFMNDQFDGSTRVMSGWKNKVFVAAWEAHPTLNGVCQSVIIEKDLAEGTVLRKIYPTIEGEEVKFMRTSEIFAIEVFENAQGNLMMLLVYADANEANEFDYFFDLYDLKQRTPIYSRKRAIPLNFRTQPILTNGKIYLYNRDGIYVFDYATGDPLWHIEESISSNVVVEGQQLIYGNPTGESLVCVDANSGNAIWSVDAGGFPPNFILVKNNQVFMKSKVLQIHQLSDGILQKTIQNPYLEKETFSFFSNAVPFFVETNGERQEMMLYFGGDGDVFSYRIGE